jgi:hypothetical protein
MKIMNFVTNYDSPNRPQHIYDKFFTKGSLLWTKWGSTTSRLPHCCVENSRALKRTTSQEGALAYLDEFFKRNDIDLAPDKIDVRFTKMTWLEVYDGYVLNCAVLGILVVRYDKFCSIRYFFNNSKCIVM